MADFKQFCETYHKLFLTKNISEKLLLNDKITFISKHILQNIHESFVFYKSIKERLSSHENKYNDFVYEIIEKCYEIYELKKTKSSNDSKKYNEYEKLLNIVCDEKNKNFTSIEKLQNLVRKILSIKNSMYPDSLILNDGITCVYKDIKYIINLIDSKCSLDQKEMLSSKSKAQIILESYEKTKATNIHEYFKVFIKNLHKNLLTRNYLIEKNKILLINEIEYFLKEINKNDNQVLNV